MPKELLERLKTVWVAGQQLRISPSGQPPSAKPSGAKLELGARKAGGDRRFAEKSEDKPFKKPARKTAP